MARINLQMYSFADGNNEDTRANLRAAARMGFDGVELFGPNFSIPAGEMKIILTILKLEAVSLHAETENIESMIPYAKTLGMKFIGIGMKNMFSDEEVHAYAKTLDELGARCRQAGLTLTYHNHTQEFAPCGDRRIIDVLLQETSPENLSMELDAGWCAAAG
ncbi:MAG: TIM barrel protein, partial [Parasporobacterium sp.]|nr:TIM barrel protein [Parasporobacterium sp.]